MALTCSRQGGGYWSTYCSHSEKYALCHKVVIVQVQRSAVYKVGVGLRYVTSTSVVVITAAEAVNRSHTAFVARLDAGLYSLRRDQGITIVGDENVPSHIDQRAD